MTNLSVYSWHLDRQSFPDNACTFWFASLACERRWCIHVSSVRTVLGRNNLDAKIKKRIKDDERGAPKAMKIE